MELKNHRGRDSLASWFLKATWPPPPKPGCLASAHSLSLQDVAAVTGLFIAVDLIFFFHRKISHKGKGDIERYCPSSSCRLLTARFRWLKSGSTG